MEKRNSKRFKTMSGVLVLIVSLLLVKLGLTVTHLVQQTGETKLASFPSEVLAEERKDERKTKTAKAEPSAQKKTPAPSGSPADMVSYLEQRETEVKHKEEQLRQKEEYLTQMQQDVEKKLKDLTVIQKEIQAYRNEKEDAQTGKIRSLAKIYGSMKPKEAAKLLENLDDQLVVKIVSTMNADEAASLLGNMDVKKAAKISEVLTHR
jgi:flagellar motility protein MotE (MotC chaperone)